MVGFFLTDFLLTKRIGFKIHLVKKKNKNKKRRKGHLTNPIGLRLSFHGS